MLVDISPDWEHFEFADSHISSCTINAHVLSLELKNLSMSAKHQQNVTDGWVSLRNCHLEFSGVKDFEAKSYDSNSDSYTDLSDCVIDIYVICRVERGTGTWTMSGWLREGPWVDIKFNFSSVTLQALDPRT
jgi:hypothetical protein